MTVHITVIHQAEAFRCAVCKVGRTPVLYLKQIKILFLDISVLRRDPLLPHVRDDRGPPEGGPQVDRGDLSPLLHSPALQPSPLELQALSVLINDQFNDQ